MKELDCVKCGCEWWFRWEGKFYIGEWLSRIIEEYDCFDLIVLSEVRGVVNYYFYFIEFLGLNEKSNIIYFSVRNLVSIYVLIICVL